MNRREVIVGASGATAGAAVAAPRIATAPVGLVGDGVADDAPAIQAALDRAGQNGGGVVMLPSPAVHYRIGSGLKLPSHVSLEGPAPVRYPFNAGNKGACALVADFVDARQWMIEPRTLAPSGVVAFDQVIGGALPDGVTYNCGVRNLLLTSKGKVPFGGVRMHGCPGSFVDGVSIERTGCGLLVNNCSGGEYRVNVRTLYYGVVVWDEANANVFQIYCAQCVPWPKSIPPEYRLPFMARMRGHFGDTLKLASEDHAERPYGLICGSMRSTSTGNVFDAVVERYRGGIFLYNAYATDFRQCYLESDAGTMDCAIAASRSRFSIQALHAYLSGTGAIFEFGIEVIAKIFASGILHGATFGKPPFDDGASLLILEGVDPAMPGAPLQRGIRYAGREAAWIRLALQSGWRAADDDPPSVRLDPWSHRVEFKGSITGGKAGICFTLPLSCRPPGRRSYMVPGGQVDINADGVATVTPVGAVVSLDGIAFARW